jgi:hypothetical protein
LLYINGGLIIAGMVALIGQGALSGPNSSSVYSTVGSTLALGAILVGLGIWKAVINKRKIEQSTQTQKK